MSSGEFSNRITVRAAAHVHNLILEFLDATQASVGQVSTNLMQAHRIEYWTCAVCARRRRRERNIPGRQIGPVA
jgi:hypothetical protein